MIGTYGQADAEQDGWLDCKGYSRFVLAPYCAPKIAYEKATGALDSARQQASKVGRTLKTIAIIFGMSALGVGVFLGVNALRKRRTRRNPKKKQSIFNRLFRILGGLTLTGLGALGYVGPQAAEPISTIVGGGMSMGGLYLIGSGVVGKDEAQKIRKELKG